ncbi:CbaC protein [Halobacteria archaeon HArc-gm2]|nr:CbaC protein [Halobacteria archaeon HArc-gm2]
MSGRISRAGLLVILAFLVPVIVEFRTLAALFGVSLSVGQYLVAVTGLVMAVLLAVTAWNLRAGTTADDHTGGA